MGAGFFPLDEELELLPGALAPRLQQSLVRLGTWMPFARAAGELAWFSRVTVSEETARRRTEAAGAAYVAEQTAEATTIEREAPEPPAGPVVQQLSADGAMIPLVGGQWAEARTLVLGTVVRGAGGEPHAEDLSYFSRRAEHETFRRLALVETQRRGTATAGRVVAVLDGATWLQGFVDYHRPDAVRVLDFPHAVEYLSAAAQEAFGAGTAASSTWLETHCHTLKHQTPTRVLAALEALPAGAARDTALGYLTARLPQLRYAEFRAAGYPIGSGIVESANKLVVEARLKGSGMHWAPHSVDPLLALRTIACSDRWADAWPPITTRWRATRRPPPRRPAAPPLPLPAPAAPPPPPAPPPASPPVPAPSKTIIDGHPTRQHPWKRRFLPPRLVTPH